MEILAPAGSIEMMKMAVRHGADAVYLGLPIFSARAKATEFTQENLADHTAYCHKFGVKVYLTLNTIVKQSEMSDALNAARAGAAAGVDGVLVQDLGLARLIRRCLPQLPLHASTQMGVHNVEGARYVKELGFSRVVLSREATLEDIKAIKEKTGLEVEVFVHGALCVSFSGNCYYSSLVSANSGNRGKCLQLCRKTYTANYDGKETSGALLSPSDLCLAQAIESLRAAGVDSLKIEGRLKRPEYVGVAVGVYKRAERGDRITAQDVTDLKSMFNRGGFCEGYINGGANFVGQTHSAHAGVRIGTVKSVSEHSFLLQSKETLDREDGFKVLRLNREVGGGTHPKLLQDDLYRISKMGDILPGDEVWRTTDAALMRAQWITDPKLKLDIRAVIKSGEPIVLVGRVNNHTHTLTADAPQNAVNAPLTQEQIVRALSKLGETDYVAGNIEVETSNAFLPKFELNALRRALTDLIDKSFFASETMVETFEFPILSDKLNVMRPVKRYYACHNESDLQKYAGKQDAALVFDPRNYINLPKNTVGAYLNLPTVASVQDIALFNRQKEIIKTYRGIVANNVYALQLAKEWQMPVIAGFMLNVANYEYGTAFDDVFFSVENLAENDAVAFGFGEFPLMHLEHCPFRAASGKECSDCAYSKNFTLTDERGKVMTVVRIVTSKCRFLLCDRLELPQCERKRRLYIETSDTVGVEKFLRGERVYENNNYFKSEFC